MLFISVYLETQATFKAQTQPHVSKSKILSTLSVLAVLEHPALLSPPCGGGPEDLHGKRALEVVGATWAGAIFAVGVQPTPIQTRTGRAHSAWSSSTSSAASTQLTLRTCRHTDRGQTQSANPPSSTRYPTPASTSLLPARTPPHSPPFISLHNLWSAQGIPHPCSYTDLKYLQAALPATSVCQG